MDRRIGRSPPGAFGNQGNNPCRIAHAVGWTPDTGPLEHTGRSYHADPRTGHHSRVCLRTGHPVPVGTGSFFANDLPLRLGCCVARSVGRVVLVGLAGYIRTGPLYDSWIDKLHTGFALCIPLPSVRHSDRLYIELPAGTGDLHRWVAPVAVLPV